MRQRLLLESLATAPADGGVWVTDPEETHAEQVAMRRAAYRLEELGKLKIVVVDGRLVAVRPHAPFRRYSVTGIDGKTYRTATGLPMDDA